MSDRPAATIRTQVTIPLQFADGYTTPARGCSPSTAWSTGASTSRSGSATGRTRVRARRGGRRWCGCTASA